MCGTSKPGVADIEYGPRSVPCPQLRASELATDADFHSGAVAACPASRPAASATDRWQRRRAGGAPGVPRSAAGRTGARWRQRDQDGVGVLPAGDEADAVGEQAHHQGQGGELGAGRPARPARPSSVRATTLVLPGKPAAGELALPAAQRAAVGDHAAPSGRWCTPGWCRSRRPAAIEHQQAERRTVAAGHAPT